MKASNDKPLDGIRTNHDRGDSGKNTNSRLIYRFMLSNRALTTIHHQESKSSVGWCMLKCSTATWNTWSAFSISCLSFGSLTWYHMTCSQKNMRWKQWPNPIPGVHGFIEALFSSKEGTGSRRARRFSPVAVVFSSFWHDARASVVGPRHGGAVPGPA